ncbi:MAG: DUF502 domain-containing protein [Nitrospirota bacterium]|nr:DUF502 domain-containing protein [Nitrospirota bacterium]
MHVHFHFQHITATFKAKFIAGLFVTAPLIITLSAITWLFKYVDSFVRDTLESLGIPGIPGLGLLVFIGLVFMVGMVSTYGIGKRIIKVGEDLLLRLPLVKSVYTAVKQLVDAFSPHNANAFKKFVIVEYPRQGAYAFGFLTSNIIKRGNGLDEQLSSVYIPTNHLYLGEIALFKADEVFYPNITVEEGIRLVLSGGTATPSVIIGEQQGSSKGE